MLIFPWSGCKAGKSYGIPAFSFTLGHTAWLGQQTVYSAAICYKLAVQTISQQNVICCSLRLSINIGQINGA